MARYVVLSFEDNDCAEKFVEYKQLQSADQDVQAVVETGTVIGLFAQPTQFCENSGSGGCSKGKRVRGWSRGKKYGWWVCSGCHKPSALRNGQHVARHVISQAVNLMPSIISQAVNLLDPDDAPASVHDEGWGAYRDGVIVR